MAKRFYGKKAKAAALLVALIMMLTMAVPGAYALNSQQNKAFNYCGYEYVDSNTIYVYLDKTTPDSINNPVKEQFKITKVSDSSDVPISSLTQGSGSGISDSGLTQGTWITLDTTNMAAETVLPVTTDNSKVKTTLASLQVPFVQNQGQINDASVKFYARTFAGTVFVTDWGITYALYGEEQGWAVHEEFAGAAAVDPVGYTSSPTKVSNFVGNDPDHWKRDLPTFEEVALGEMYDKIDVKLRAYGNNVEKIFTVAPGGDPDAIMLKVAGADRLSVNDQGELELVTGMGTVKMTSPMAYQEIDDQQVNVAVTYELKGDGYGFALDSYDPAYPLTIDPLLASTFLGGVTGFNYIYDLALDSSGNIFVGGITSSTDFPLGAGAIDSTGDASNYDLFISKLKSDLSGPLLASTYFGGSDVEDDESLALALDSSDNLYVTGSTSSTDFPVTVTQEPYQSTLNGQRDVFVSKFNSDLSQLLASTYLGGAKDDTPYDLTLDSSGHVFVAGNTGSTDFPTSTGALDSTFTGNLSEGFVSRFNPDLSASDFKSTLIGGYSSESVFCIYIDPEDSSGNVFVGGSTKYESTVETALPPVGFPRTTGAFRTEWTNTGKSGSEGFIAKLSNDLSGSDGYPLASTFLGLKVTPYAMCFDNTSEKNLYITGCTREYLTTTDGIYDDSHAGSNDIFIMKLTNGLAGNGLGSGNTTQPLAATYLGHSGSETARCIEIDSLDNVIVAGETYSTSYPTTEGAFDIQYETGEAFISKLKADLSGPLLASTFLGGSGNDLAKAISLDSADKIYVAGYTRSQTGFPVSSGAFDQSPTTTTLHKGFISKFSADLLLEAPTAPVWTEGSLSAGDIDPTTLTLSWSGASESDENGGITGYKIYQDDVEINTVAGTADSYAVTGLTQDTEYTFKVEAGNGLGNWSTDGPVLTTRTIIPDFDAPTWPEGSTLRVDS